MTLTIKQPWDVPELDLNAFQYKFLAEGDSWFSIGEFPPWATSSLLFGMSYSFAASNLVINCASQGDSLSHMHQMWYDNNFTRMLDAPHLGYYWDALLLSAGGNDLIDACLVASTVTDPAQRLLLRPEEIPPGAPPEACISTGGWKAFEGYLRANFSDLVQRRDHGVNHDLLVSDPNKSKDGEKWTAAVNLQPTIPKPDRLLVTKGLIERTQPATRQQLTKAFP